MSRSRRFPLNRMPAISGSIWVATLLLLVTPGIAHPQAPAEAIDSLFSEWDSSDSPGCVCAVSDQRGILFERGYGMANLEWGTPLTPNSVFYVASVSKQFVSASLALLVQRGLVSLDADARSLLPQLSHIGQAIQVRQLGQHTSGVRDYFSLHRLAGAHELDHLDNATVLDLLSRQRSLEFVPGQRYSYSNSNYILLTELVERTSGQTLREFTTVELFGPLGMTDTQFEDDHTHVVTRRVSSYERRADSYRRHVKEFDVVGDGGLLSTVRDLTAWGRNFLDPEVGGQPLVALMTERATLADGSPLDYGLGLRLNEVNGVPSFGHTGSFKGFRTRLLILPNSNLVFSVLCNAAEADATRLTEQVATLWLRSRESAASRSSQANQAPESAASREEVPIELTSAQLDRWTGHYWSDAEASARNIYRRDGTLSYGRERTDTPLVPIAPDRFTMPGYGIPIYFDFSRDESGRRRTRMQIGDVQTIDYEEYTPFDAETLNPDEYVGKFVSEELAVTYRVRRTDDGLVLEAGRAGRLGPLRPIMDDLLQTRIEGNTYTLRFDRREGVVRGFRLDSGQSHGLAFSRAMIADVTPSTR